MGLVPRYLTALPDRRPGRLRIVAVNGTHRPPDALAPLINVRSGAEADKLTPNVTKFCPTLACTNPHVETVLSYAAARSSRLVPSRYPWRARARTDTASSQQAAPPRLAGAQLYVYMANISVWHTVFQYGLRSDPTPSLGRGMWTRTESSARRLSRRASSSRRMVSLSASVECVGCRPGSVSECVCV